MIKKLLTTFGLLLTLAATTHAQTPPDAFSYSAVARDANSNPIATTTIGIQISLRQGSPLGTVVYQENHFVNTDQFGLFNLTVGGGLVQSGNISTIDWAAANHYLQVGMDANGSTNFLNMGTTQLLSVPYALYAKNAGTVGGGTGITISSVSSAGDTLYLSNGQTFVNGSNGVGGITIASVTTANATNVTGSSASIGGNVTASGGELILARGVCLSTITNPTVDDVIIGLGNGTGAFSGVASGLQAGTTYHVRAYATNSSGTAYGNNVNFTTPLQGSITALNCGSATINGTLTVGTAASGVSSSVPYTGGNGGPHNGQTVNSTSVTGLTATLSAGSFANGSGSVTYTITGVPSAAGTASFVLNIGGQTCTLNRLVLSPGDIGSSGCSPDPVYAQSASGFYPDSITFISNEAISGVDYLAYINLKTFTDTVFPNPLGGTVNYRIDAFKILDVIGLPAGFEVNAGGSTWNQGELTWLNQGAGGNCTSLLPAQGCMELSASGAAVSAVAPSVGFTDYPISIFIDYRVACSSPDIQFLIPNGSWMSSVPENLGGGAIMLNKYVIRVLAQ